jgi:hypothetical protein
MDLQLNPTGIREKWNGKKWKDGISEGWNIG